MIQYKDASGNPCTLRELVAMDPHLKRERSGPPLIYVAGPYTAKTRAEVERNVLAAERVGIMIAQLGGMPVIPHCNTSAPAFERVQPYEFWIAGTLALMYCCDAVVMVPGWQSSRGATGERAEAIRVGRPVIEAQSEHPVAFDSAMIEAVRELIARLR